MSEKQTYKKRTSFWPTIVSMTFVLFFVGLIGIIALYSSHLSDYYKSNFEVFLFFNDDVEEVKAKEIETQLLKNGMVNKITFVHRDIAARKEIERTGIDFLKTLEKNPFPHSLEILLKPEAADEQKIKSLENQLKSIQGVNDVVYAKDDFGKNMLSEINKNFKSIEKILAVITFILLVIAIVLINSTVRLNMFARRFIIKSMQYVGASDWFIIKPFLGMYFIYALVSTFLAITMLTGCVYLLENQLQNGTWKIFLPKFSILAGILLLLAVVIILISVFFSTKKYLKLKIDQLY